MMNELYKSILELTFASFCKDITQKDEATIEFRLKYRFHGNRKKEVFALHKTEDGLFVSDKGSTLANLGDIFYLNDPDVIKNLKTVLAHFDIRKKGNEFLSAVDVSNEVPPQIMRYLQGIHFMYTMKVFYK